MSSKLKRHKFSKYLCFHGGRYLGSSLVDQPTGEEATSSAIKTISTMVKKLIIDTDTGVDDAMAILMALETHKR